MSHKQFFVTPNSSQVFYQYFINNLPGFSNLSRYFKEVFCTGGMSFGRLLSAALGLVLCFFTFQADAQSTRDSDFVINGTVAGVDSGIIRMLGKGTEDVTDSAVIVKGKFVLRGKISSPQRKVFNIVPGNWTFRAFVDAPVITFNVDTLQGMREHYKDAFSFIYQIEETGSPIADVYREYENAMGLTDYSLLIKKLNSAEKDSLAPVNNKMGEIRKLFPKKTKLWIENYIRENPASPVGVFIFDEYYYSSGNTSPIYLRSMLSRFSGAAKTSSYYKGLSKQLSILENVQTGKLAPDFTLLKSDKSKFKLSATRGSVIMLDFWASWCVPCRAGIPHWKKVYAKYHRKNFNIVSISNDRHRNPWIKALDQEKMPWTQVIDRFPSPTSTAVVSDLYAVPSLPFFVLLNEKGEIILSSGDEHIITKKIDEIFKKTTQLDNYAIPSLHFHSRRRTTAVKAAADKG